MKTLTLSVLFVIMLTSACRTPNPTVRGGNQTMLIEQSPLSDGKSVKMVRENKPIRPIESMGELKDNPNIAQTDLDAAEARKTKEIQFVKEGEKLRLYETNSIGKN